MALNVYSVLYGSAKKECEIMSELLYDKRYIALYWDIAVNHRTTLIIDCIN